MSIPSSVEPHRTQGWLAQALVALDRRVGDIDTSVFLGALLYEAGASGSRDLLSVIATSSLAVAGTAFSIAARVRTDLRGTVDRLYPETLGQGEDQGPDDEAGLVVRASRPQPSAGRYDSHGVLRVHAPYLDVAELVSGVLDRKRWYRPRPSR